MGGLALAMLAVYALGHRRESVWPGTLLRTLAAAGIVVPGMAVLGWYRQLLRAREWSRDLPVQPESIAEMFMARSAVLMTAGFFLLVGGIFLARRLPERPKP